MAYKTSCVILCQIHPCRIIANILFNHAGKIRGYIPFPRVSVRKKKLFAQEYCNHVRWGYRTHQWHLCRGVRPSPNEIPWYNTKQSDGEAPVKLWGMRSTSSLISLPGPLSPEAVAPDRVLSTDQIWLFNF